MRLLVTGAGGMVGGYVREVFADAELLLTDIGEGLPRLDVRDPLAVRRAVADVLPDLVLHLAAATDVDRCEQEPELAQQSNALGTHNVALACQAEGTLLVYVSTGAGFSGDKPEPYVELDATGPVNLYAHSKLAGEEAVASLLQRYYIVRAGWMFGGGERDTKFVGKIAQLMLQGRPRIEAVDDKIGSPTYARDLLAAIRPLLDTEAYGVYHVANPEAASRYQMALAIREALGRPATVIEPVSSARFPLPAPRGRSEALRNLKLELLGMKLRPWEEALHEYVQQSRSRWRSTG
jgi:dTDP-4-dehydrorhamnose reductase